MSMGVLVTLELGHPHPMQIPVRVSNADLARLKADVAAGPGAQIRCPNGGPTLPVAVPDTLLQNLIRTKRRKEMAALEIEAGGICRMPKNVPFYIATHEDSTLNVWKGNVIIRGRIRVRYRISLGSGKEETILDDAEAAKRRADDILKNRVKMQKLENVPAGRDFLDKAARTFARFDELDADPDVFLPALIGAYKEVCAAHAIGFLPGSGETKTPSIPEVLLKYAARERLLRDLKRMSVPAAVDEYVAHVESLWSHDQITPTTCRKHVSHARQFKKRFPTKDMHEIEGVEIDRWLGPASGTRRDRRMVVAALYERARDVHRSVPFGRTVMADITGKGYKPLKGRMKEEYNVEYYSDADTRAIFSAVHADLALHKWIPTMVLWFYGGIHFSEIFKLTWKQISTMGLGGKVEISKSVAGKNHAARTVVLCPAAYSWLKRMFIPEVITAEWLDSPIVPARPPGRNPKTAEERSHVAWRAFFSKVVVGLGIKDIENGMRHAFCTHLYGLTRNLAYTQRQAGSHTIDMFEHYIAEEVSAEESASYFCNGHPDAGFFDPAVKFLSDRKFHTEEDAADELDKARMMTDKQREEFVMAEASI